MNTPPQTPPRTPDLSVEAFAALLPPRGALLGFDLGSKTVGLALSDVERQQAGTLATLERGKFAQDWARLARLIERENIVGFVMGLPLNMDGTAGPRVQSSRTYARSLRTVSPLPLLFWDERLSTYEAEQAMIAANVTRAKRAAVIDAAAARVILQGALDALP